MKLATIAEILKAEVYTGETPEQLAEIDIFAACGSDLMSDVLAFVKTQGLLLTGLINPQVVRTAEMMDMKAVILVRGKDPSDNIIELAQEKGIVVLSTDYTMYVSCGKLYKSGLYEKEEE